MAFEKLEKKINQINSDDFDYALSETSSEMILYVSYTGSSEIRNIEDRLYKEASAQYLSCCSKGYCQC